MHIILQAQAQGQLDPLKSEPTPSTLYTHTYSVYLSVVLITFHFSEHRRLIQHRYDFTETDPLRVSRQ